MSDGHLCTANGCTLAGTISAGGSSACFVHHAVRERSDWDRATSRMRRQPGLLDAISRLRRGSSALEIENGMAPVLHLLPPGVPPSRYACLQAAEGALIAECTAPQSDGASLADQMPEVALTESRQDRHDRAIANLREASKSAPAELMRLAALSYRRIYGRELDLRGGVADAISDRHDSALRESAANN